MFPLLTHYRRPSDFQSSFGIDNSLWGDIVRDLSEGL